MTKTWLGVGKYLSRQGSCQLRWPATSLPGKNLFSQNTLKPLEFNRAELLRVAEKRVEEGKEAGLDASSLAVLVARVGATDQKIVTSTIEEGRLGQVFHQEVF